MAWILILLLAGAPTVRQEIVVTAERGDVPQSELTTASTVLTRDHIETIPASNAAEVLALVPGLTMFGGSSTIPATLTVRGFYGGGEVDTTRLLVDGAPLADAESNVAPWQQLHANEIERVEVVRGLASPVYGDAAFGGVVQLFTRSRKPGDWTLLLTAGSHATTEANGGVWTSLAGGELGASADWRESDGDRPHAASSQRGARLRWRREALSLTASTRTIDRDDPGPDPSFDLFQDDGEHHDRHQLAAAYDSRHWRASAHANTKRGESTRTIILFPPFGDTATRDLDSRELGASLLAHGEIFRGGIDVARQQFGAAWSDEILLARTNVQRNLIAAHATARKSLGPNLTAVAGARYDSISGDRRAFSPRLGLAMQRGATSFYVSASDGFTAPTLEQLHDQRPLRLFGDSFTLSNPALEPQRARAFDAGVAHASRFGSIAVDAYLIRVRDEIDFDVQTFRYANLARSEHRGVEVLFEPRHARAPRLTYAWTRVTDRATDAQLKNIPEHSATVMLPLPYVTLFYSWNAGRFFDDAEETAAPDTHALSLRAQKRFGRARVFVDALNLTNNDNVALGYVIAGSTFAYPDQRRTFRVSLAFE